MDDRQQRGSGLPVPPAQTAQRPWDKPKPSPTSAPARGYEEEDDTPRTGGLGFLRRHLMSVIMFTLLTSGVLIQAWRDLSQGDAFDYWKDLYSTPSLTSSLVSDVDLDGRKRTALVLRGQIGPAAGSWFRERLDEAKLKPGDVVLLSSPGGNLVQSMIMGENIRSHGLVTAVGTIDSAGQIRPGSCASACVTAFAGGTVRYDIPGSRLGVHRFTSRGGGGGGADAVADTQRTTGVMLAYLNRMGISASLVELMSATSDIRWLDSRQTSETNLVTAQARGSRG